jgi:hypothetical protein
VAKLAGEDAAHVEDGFDAVRRDLKRIRVIEDPAILQIRYETARDYYIGFGRIPLNSENGTTDASKSCRDLGKLHETDFLFGADG